MEKQNISFVAVVRGINSSKIITIPPKVPVKKGVIYQFTVQMEEIKED